VRVAAAAAQPTPAVRRAAVRTLFDFCGCVIGGCGSLPSWPLDRAGRLALCAHLRDQDDLHLASVTHPGGVVWSAVAACALERETTIGEALAAAAFGYELTVRLAEALGGEHRQRWHVTATAGTVGAAGAAARVLSSDGEAVLDAVSHAVSVTGGSAHAMLERTGTRFLHRAHAASSGIVCARAACAGVQGGRSALESGRGALATETPESFAASLLAERDAACVEETGFRLHAATGFAQAPIDAALSAGQIDPGELEQVEVTVAPPAAPALASNPAPADDEQAWWSIEHAVAVCLATGDADALTGGRSERADVLELCRRVVVRGGGAGWAATVKATRRDGSVRTGAVDGPLGHGPKPASDNDLCRKWRRLTALDGSSFLHRLLDGDDAEWFAPMLKHIAFPTEAAALLR
jgi:2-methylcitrate dehydratase PrpD